nr:PREDICTED: nucleoside diphosphate kinase 7 isoform X2 [Bemisia tabaci]
MSHDFFEKYNFIAEWFDPEASFSKKFHLSYFIKDDSIELFDLRNLRMFLKRTKCDGVRLCDIYVGASVKIYSRLMKIVDYADVETKRKLSQTSQKTFGFIKPDGINKKGAIFDMILERGLKVVNLKMVLMNNDLARRFLRDQFNDYSDILSHEQILVSGPCILFELIGENSVQVLKELAGPTNPDIARKEAPTTIRGLFGKDTLHNVLHAAESFEAAGKEAKIFLFGEPSTLEKNFQPCMTVTNSTFCTIKPHAIQEGLMGKIIAMIEEKNFKVTGMKMFHLNTAQAEEFLEVYKSVVPEYSGMVSQLSSGPCLAMTVESESHGPNTPQEFRNFAGPSDPDIAKELRPNTIRAKFGKDKVKNAIHVTDLPEDAPLEIEYFFQLLE